MPNQRDIARKLGLCQGTVSLALRDSPLIAPGTRKQVQAAAGKMGYHPNPMVAALMEHVRSGKPVKDKGCLAILVDFAGREEWLNFHPAYRQQFDAITRQAAQRGYRTECFFLRAPGLTPARVDRILYHRGITGIILAGPRQDDSYPLKMKWERYACVKSGYTWPDIPVDCVSADNRQHVELAFQALWKAGCRRIGYCLHQAMVERADSNWLLGHIISQRRIPAENRIPLMLIQSTASGKGRFHRWLDRWKPDVVIGGHLENAWLADHRRPPLFCARFHEPEEKSIPAVMENNITIGETLCDNVVEQIIHNKRGIPAHPRMILIKGSWFPGRIPSA